MVMKKAGQVVVIKFPQTDFQKSKNNFDEIVYENSIDFISQD